MNILFFLKSEGIVYVGRVKRCLNLGMLTIEACPPRLSLDKHLGASTKRFWSAWLFGYLLNYWDQKGYFILMIYIRYKFP
jgi:hypothetical protein